MKKILFISMIVLSTVCAIAQTNTNKVKVAWNAHCDTNVAGYKIYYGNGNTLSTNIIQSHIDDCGVSWPTWTNIYHQPYTNFVSVSGRTNTTATISNLTSGVTYHLAAVAVAASGIESDFSNEVSYTIPTPPMPPTDFRFIDPK